MEALLRLLQTIVTSEGNRSSRQNSLLSLRPDCVTKLKFCDSDHPYVRDDYMQNRLKKPVSKPQTIIDCFVDYSKFNHCSCCVTLYGTTSTCVGRLQNEPLVAGCTTKNVP